MSSHLPFTLEQKRCRAVCLTLLLCGLVLFTLWRPENVPQWFPFATSCGAITGLPCLFCGTTRAIHHLLNGEFGRALYYNWLAFPIVTGAFALIAIVGCELFLGRNLLARLPRPRITPRKIGMLATGLVLLWVLQVYLAVSQDKAELLNPRGPLYWVVVSGTH